LVFSYGQKVTKSNVLPKLLRTLRPFDRDSWCPPMVQNYQIEQREGYSIR